MEFRIPEAKEMLEIAPFFNHQRFRTCDYTIGGYYMWRHFFVSEYAIYKNTLFSKVSKYLGNEICFTFPIGQLPTEEALSLIETEAKNQNLQLKFCAIPEEALPFLTERYKEKINITAVRDWFDYVYIAEAFANLKGKKYSAQRNHINRFNKDFPDWKYLELTPENIHLVYPLLKKYNDPDLEKDPLEKEELDRSIEILEHFELFNFTGGCILLNNEVIAFSIGEIVNDTLFVHIEKAQKDYSGIYQVMSNTFVKEMMKDHSIYYVNREEDVGDAGLRKSKLSYNPDKLLEKYFISVDL